MTRRRVALLVAAFAAALLAAWLQWPATPPPAPGPVVTRAEARPSPSGAMRSAAGATFPSANITASTKPCVRGRVVNAASHAGVPGAQVVLATPSGALQAQAAATGSFEFTLADDVVRVDLAEVSAEGYFPFRPQWGHSPIELTLKPGTCVSELVLTLVPRVQYRGVVLSPEEQPVEGATVTSSTADEPPGAPMRTDAQGEFSFSAEEGAVLVARHPKFSPGAATVDFRAGVTREVVIKLGVRSVDAGVERATLTGSVVDVRDAGVAGAQVRALQHFAEERDSRVEGAAETDAEGRFSFEVEGPGPWLVFAVVPGVLANPVTTAGEPVVLRLLAGTELRGRVTDGQGRAVQSFSVMIGHRDGPLRIESEDVRHVVDAEGRFGIQGLAPGPAQVMVAALGYAPSDQQDVELTIGVPASVEVKLREGARVSGRVIDRQSKAPLEGARISLEGQVDSTLVATPSARSDADGGFVLSGVSPGRRSIFIAAEQHHARLVSVEAKEGATTGPLLIDLGALEKGEEPRLELVGIGAVLEAKGDALVLKQVMPGGGAAEVGLVAGDGIVFIEGQSAAKLGFGGGVELIRGPEGTYVNLEVRRVDGSLARVVVLRRRIER